MSLHRQLVLLITGLLLVLLGGICYLSVHNSRVFLEKQLYTHAQDTATSLGLSAARAVAEDDLALAQSMVDAIFDRGDYQDIFIRNRRGEILVRRQAEPPAYFAPAWFADWLQLNPMDGISEMSHGWERVGEVTIRSDRNRAINTLWLAAKQAASLFVLAGFVSWVIVLLIVRAILRPLRELEQQADAICNRDFTGQQPLPKTREIKRVVQAINRMTRQLKVLFDEQVAQIEQVRNQAYVDSVTGLGNGRFFNSQLMARLEAPDESFGGALARLQIRGLAEYNELYGHDAGNLLLRRIGQTWRNAMQDVEGHCVARVAGARFAVLLPHLSREAAHQKIAQAVTKITELDALNQGGASVQIYAGVSHCVPGQDARLLEPQASAALERAFSFASGHLECFTEADHGAALMPTVAGVADWAAFLRDVIARRDVVLHYQPVISCVDQSLMHHEVLARIAVNGKLVTAGHFIPLVERYSMVVDFDKMVIGLLIEQIRQQPAATRKPLAINLSSYSIRSEGFDDWLLGTLQAHRDLASLLIFEVPELTVRTAHGKLHRLAKGLKEVGARLTIDHFGTTNSSFGYLSGLPLYSIKVDNSYIRDIEHNLDHQFFVQSLVRIAHSRQILLTAEMVEGTEQWNLLRRLQLDGAQGYFLGEPQAEKVAA